MADEPSMRDQAPRDPRRRPRRTLSHDLLGLSPGELSGEARALTEAAALIPEVRERLKHRLIEHLKTPVDTPSWGPDWVQKSRQREGRASFVSQPKKDDKAEEPATILPAGDHSDSQVIVRNIERSRQVSQYQGLYVGAAILAVVIAFLAMFVDYQIINGDVWTRALANEFMIVPDSLKDSVVFKSLQVVFAALAVHFMLKITGVYGRNILISAAFSLTIVMVVCLGYLVAYNNMEGGTSAQRIVAPAEASDTIDALFTSLDGVKPAGTVQPQAAAIAAPLNEVSVPLPKLSAQSLANADSWLWLSFASVIFFIVTTICALYMEVAENNLRNFLIARDYGARRRQYAQLHLLELAGRQATGAPAPEA